MNFSSLIFLIFLLCCIKPCFSQIKFENFTTDEGISSNNITCFLKDSKGFIWIGTREGLNQFNGYDFKVYENDPEDSTSISNNIIKFILEDKKGRFWVGTKSGLNLFDPVLEKFKRYYSNKANKFNLSDDDLLSIFEDSEGTVWIGTENGLNKYREESDDFISYLPDDKKNGSLKGKAILSITEDSDGFLWIGTWGGGLNKLDKQTNIFTNHQNDPTNIESLSENNIWSLIQANDESLLVGAYSGVLNKFDLKTGKVKRYYNEDNEPFGVISDIIKDPEGNFWIGTRNGLFYLNNATEKLTHFQHRQNDNESIISNYINSIYLDNSNILWIGTRDGFSRYCVEQNKFKTFLKGEEFNDLPNPIYISAIYSFNDSIYWIGTDYGLLKYDLIRNEVVKRYVSNDDKQSLSSNIIKSLYKSTNGKLWIATQSGLNEFDIVSEKFTKYYHKSFLETQFSDNDYRTIIEDDEGELWTGTDAGIKIFNIKTNTTTHYFNNPNDSTSLSKNQIICLYKDNDGDIWVGTDGGGLNKFDRNNKNFIRYQTLNNRKNGISSNIVYSIFQDTEGIFWMGTSEGLNSFNKTTGDFTVYDTRSGLTTKIIIGCLEDNEGKLWLSTAKGLSQFCKESLLFSNFDKRDGLQSNVFSLNAKFKNKKGELFFGGKDGMNIFLPVEIPENKTTPPVYITNLKILNQPVKIGHDQILKKSILYAQEIELPYDQNVITFEFASLNFLLSEKNQYAYQMVGFDRNWNHVGSKRNADYTNLNPGEYFFKVKASNNDGLWNEEGAILKITITPPFWKTYWFATLVGLFIIGSLISIYKTRINIIKNQKLELEKQVSDRTAEVVQQKEEIQAQSEILEQVYAEIKDSIRAAENIQSSILPSITSINKHLPECFIFNKPKDVVSGDFYWFDEIKDQIVVAAVDCTGHGVSGAFMSINGFHLLNQSIYSYYNLKASDILNRLNEGVIKVLHQNDIDNEVMDGMDIALCIIDKKNKTLQYAGANNPLYMIRRNEITEIKADKFAIGVSVTKKISMFKNHVIKYEYGDTFYIFSDGYADQFGGKDGEEKFMYRRFRELLLNISAMPLLEQKKIISEEFEKWRGDVVQLDDILVIGFKL